MGPIVIVGGGIAGFKALRRIHEIAPDREVVLVSGEGSSACERPMLSKEMLLGHAELRSVAPPTSDRVRLIVPGWVAAINRRDRCVILATGETIAYDRLILTTGSRPRRMTDIGDGSVVHYLRTAADAEALRSQLTPGRHLIIVGGGFIGLEVACAARQRGARVTLLELKSSLLSRVAPTSVSRHLHDLHTRNGVKIRTGVQVRSIEKGWDGRIAVETSEGPEVADCVVVGIGVIPNVELALDCGLEVDNGIVVDSRCLTSDPYIFAAGEVTNYPLPGLGLRTRSESWTVAAEHGALAGETSVSSDGPEYRSLPWLWTDQYASSIQYLGLPMSAAHLIEVQGKTTESWVEIGVDDTGRMIGAIGVNANREIAELRRNSAKGQPLPEKYVDALQLQGI